MPDTPISPQIDGETLRLLLAASGTGLWDWQIDQDIVYYSDEWLALVGMPAGLFQAHLDFRRIRIHPEDASSVQEALDACIQGETKRTPYIDFRIKHAQGSWMHVRETIAITARTPQGRATRLTAMMHDNTLAKAREQRLEEECRYRTHTSELIGFLNWEWDVVNDHISSAYRYSSIIGSDIPAYEGPLSGIMAIVHPDDRSMYRQSLAEYLEQSRGDYQHILRMLVGPQKQYFWVIIHATIIGRDPLGKPTKLIGCTLNVDQNMQTQSILRTTLEETLCRCDRLMAAIERSEATRKSMFQNSPYVCIMFDSTFQVLDCNPKALAFFGFGNIDDFKREFLAFIATAIPPHQPDGALSFSLMDRLNLALQEGTHEFETELIIHGESYPLSVIMKKVEHLGGFALMTYTVDIRNRYEMIRALNLRDRLLETINKMALLLMTSNDPIERVLQEAVTELGIGANVDIAYVLKTTEIEGVPYCSLVGSWTSIKEASAVPPALPYDVIIPGWRDTLAKGKVLNVRIRDIFGYTEDVPPPIARVKISLNIPLFIKNTFWGTVGLSRCTEDRPFIKAEEDLLQSAGILIAATILRAEMTEHLLEANRAAIAGAKAKTDFLSRMSHEIRTPMNAIIGMTTLAQKALDMPRVQYCLQHIENSSHQLLGIINDVLDMSKIEANKLEIINEEFDLEHMIQHVFNVVQVKIDEKAQEFSVDVENAFTRTVISDELRLSQVLINLLTNAVKFTPDRGKISLSVHQTPLDADRARLHIAVADTGIGITDEQKTWVFRSFEQAEGSITRKYGGTGLGLSISKSIVNLMGGDIWIEDNPGGGSKFLFEIIIHWGKVCRADKLPKGLRRSLRILVVDDDRDTLEYFESMLQSFSLDCDKASCGEEALGLVERCVKEGRPYDLVFLDWKMPGMDGVETAREITGIMGGKPIIVMISAATQGEVSSAFSPLGITNFLPKPVLPSSLYNIIVSLMGYPGDTAADEECGVYVYDWSGKRLLLAEDMEVNREIVIGILEDTGITIECAENGMHAVELFTKNHYDIVLMDIQMPVMDGFNATRAIRALGKPNAGLCPIIAMTANAFKEDIRSCLAAGMNSHIAKPIDVQQLFDRIAEYLET
ncbi:MAG: response regulator [Treponema sp.]|jgi:signal transduction histidine kinase/DNA-binding response OmpR family regulator/PAS domain-containing protein|nr:response regulator [Treponema sp.]